MRVMFLSVDCGRSILLRATTIGTSAAFAWVMLSMVCGITPSSAATTTIAMSVTFAPRARMLVNASWPGVSMKVTTRSRSPALTGTVKALVAWVMPPASPAATLVLRIRSRRLVLPWSTWPRIVTTGARGRTSVRSRSAKRLSMISAAERLWATFSSMSKSIMTSTAFSVSMALLMFATVPPRKSFRRMSAAFTPVAAESSLMVIGSVSWIGCELSRVATGRGPPGIFLSESRRWALKKPSERLRRPSRSSRSRWLTPGRPPPRAMRPLRPAGSSRRPVRLAGPVPGRAGPAVPVAERGFGRLSGCSTRMTRGPESAVLVGFWSCGPAGATLVGRVGMFITGGADEAKLGSGRSGGFAAAGGAVPAGPSPGRAAPEAVSRPVTVDGRDGGAATGRFAAGETGSAATAETGTAGTEATAGMAGTAAFIAGGGAAAGFSGADSEGSTFRTTLRAAVRPSVPFGTAFGAGVTGSASSPVALPSTAGASVPVATATAVPPPANQSRIVAARPAETGDRCVETSGISSDWHFAMMSFEVTPSSFASW
jgi:hypothetical protein